MPTSNGVITAPVDASDPYYVMGVGQYNGWWDIGYAICVAKEGGKTTTGLDKNFISAFNIIENGSNGFNGTLIPGAKPYWNVFSNESPGAWEQGQLNDSALIFRLKFLLNDLSKGYGYELSNWDGYKHYSASPEDNNIVTRVAVGANKTQNIAVRYRTGEYDWRKINNSNAAQFEVIGASSNSVSPVVDLTAVNMTIIATIPVVLASTSDPHTEKFDMRLFIGRKVAINDFNSYGYVPMDSSITFEIYRPIPDAVLVVYIGGLANVFRIDKDFAENANSYTFIGTKINATVSLAAMTLEKIVYSSVNETGVVGQTVTITSVFDNENETPQDFEGFSGNTQDFVISKKRVITNTDYPYLEASMYYKKYM